MAYTDAQPFKIPRPYTYQDGVDYEDITGNVTLTHASGTYQFLKDNGGSFDINLPSLRNGATYWIRSRASSGGTMTIKDPAGSTITTITAGQAAHVVSNGVYWLLVIKA